MALDARQLKMCEDSQWDFSALNALFLNCTLKRSPELSHTQGLRGNDGGASPNRLHDRSRSLSGHD